jgi:quercetin dioxygenase-like cupin family protein
MTPETKGECRESPKRLGAPTLADARDKYEEADELAGRIGRTEVGRSSASIPGWEIVQVVSRIRPGEESGWHTHPGDEIGFVMTGNLHIRIEGRSTLFLQAGDLYTIEGRIPHNATDLGTVAGRVLSTYLVEAGKPLSTLADIDESL